MKKLYLIFMVFCASPIKTLAQINTNYDITLGKRDLIDIVISLINLLLSLLAILSVMMIIIGGFMWLTSAGSEEKIKQARTLLRNAIIGMLIILASWAIVTWLINTFGTVTNTPVI